jgi:sulfite exporter TauE/SafE/copper chaperone CopZ
MGSAIRTEKLRIGGMTCAACQNKIGRKLRNTAGVQRAEVNYATGTAVVAYNTETISLRQISDIIEKLNYTVMTGDEKRAPGTNRIIGLLIIIASLYMILEHFGLLNLLAPSRLADSTMNYAMLFVIGLITSVHCVAMCGGINLSQCVPQGGASGSDSRNSALRPAFLYNLGRIVSYTAVGFAAGALGGVIAFTSTAQGILKLIAGVFMIIMGINILEIFPWLRKLNPRMPRAVARKIDGEKEKSNRSLVVGFFFVFLPCGPLQAMQIYALSTGNPFGGALSMFLFSAGTVPLMFGLGAFASIIGKKFASKVMTAGAVLIVVLGLSMLTQGLSLSGLGAAGTSVSQSGSGVAIKDGVQMVNGTLSPRSYPAITVQAGMPVKWIIDAPKGSINGCNNRIFISEYGIEYTFNTGENIIEFTPDKAGTFQYSCWMGMIRSSITVIDGDSHR